MIILYGTTGTFDPFSSFGQYKNRPVYFVVNSPGNDPRDAIMAVRMLVNEDLVFPVAILFYLIQRFFDSLVGHSFSLVIKFF